jgi:hypothetical protein
VPLLCSIVLRLPHSPSRASTIGQDRKSQSTTTVMRLPLENHFPNNLSHLERVSHRPDNLLLQSTPRPIFFSPGPRPIQGNHNKKSGMALVMTINHTSPEKNMGNNNNWLRCDLAQAQYRRVMLHKEVQVSFMGCRLQSLHESCRGQRWRKWMLHECSV